MFELRYEERKIVACGVPDCTFPTCHTTEKVLQFRVKNKHMESPTTTPVDLGWSDWLDVPVVQAEDSDEHRD